MTNWTKIFNTLGQTTMESFAAGGLSWNRLERQARFTPVAGEVRKLLRSGGVDRARNLTKKALSRRGVNV